MPNAGAPLVDRPLDAMLFLRPAGPVSAASFLGDAHALAAALPAGGTLVNLCRDRYAFAVAFAAAVIAGRVCLLPGDGQASRPAALAERFPGCFIATDEPFGDHNPLQAVLVRPSGEAPARPPANPVIAAAQEAAVVFTSGSTGVPVAHAKPWGALVQRSRAAGERFALDGTSIVGTVPPGHMYGFETTVLLPLHAACASWCGPAFFPGDVQAAIAAVPAPRLLVTTPLQLRGLAQGGALAVAACISATAPLDPALAAAAEAAWGAPVLEIFGATECGSIASRRTVAGTDWTLYPGIALHPAEGRTVVRAPDMAPVTLADDMELQPDGTFRLLGRRADMVKLGGRRASLTGLNRILTGLPGVSDGSFVVPDDLDRRSTARLMAVVVAPGRSGQDILAELRGRVDPVFLPRRVIRVDALPRNELGKLPRQALLALLTAPGGE